MLQVFNDLDDFSVGACLPCLGLSNKAVTNGDRVASAADAADETNTNWSNNLHADPTVLTGWNFLASEMCVFPTKFFIVAEPPTEDYLMQNALWPEVHKL